MVVGREVVVRCTCVGDGRKLEGLKQPGRECHAVLNRCVPLESCVRHPFGPLVGRYVKMVIDSGGGGDDDDDHDDAKGDGQRQ